MTPIRLMSRAGCHLCDEALAIVRSQSSNVSVVDIAADPSLEARYRFTIPVACVGDAELAWPFDASAIRAAMERA